MTAQQNDDLQHLLDLFKSIEPLQKIVESLGDGLDGPALNETRNATFHLLCALLAESGDVRRIQLEKAERHAQRAIYDCHEAMLLRELDRLRDFKDSYAKVVISSIIPDWVDLVRAARDAHSSIKRARDQNGEERNNFYAEMAPHVKELNRINEICESAREELNKIIRRDNEELKRLHLEALRARSFGKWSLILGLLAAVGAWMFPVK
ncbi:MAG: hypothetical protein Q8Q28_10100 [Pseudomonadota bacterium]|nr:hypothetical protein [Pseudomonadota bacterium]